MKSIMVFLIAPVALGALALIHGSNTTPILATTSTAATETAIPQQQTGIIDGAVHPELIPDRVAYSLVFRLIANRRTAEEKSRIRAYIRHIGFADADVDGLIAAADEFHQNVSPLDAEARQIKINNRGNASPEVKAHLRELQSRKESIADHVVVRMPHRISRDAISKLQGYISEHVKRRVKIRSS